MNTKKFQGRPFIGALMLLFVISFSACDKQKTEEKASTSATDTTTTLTNSDPLPSWNEGSLKQAIINYVTKITKEGTADFIPVEDRIATFDNDGTLWPEKPIVQLEFAFYRAATMIKESPDLAKKQPFKAVAEKDMAFFEKGGLKVIGELIVATQSGMNVDDFNAEAKDFFANFTYPKYGLKGKELAYKPQVELLEYLRANGFKTYICTGGDIDFVRTISQEFYGIPVNQIIGSTLVYKYDEPSRKVNRTKESLRFNDQTEKPSGIQIVIGKRPVFACGNEGGKGDIQMLEYSQSSSYPSFQLIVNHNDSIREFVYTEPDSASLKMSAQNNWHVVDMAKDWKTVFSK